MTSPSKRDLERKLDDLEGDGDAGERREDIDLSLSVEEKEMLDERFDVEPATVKNA